MVKWRNGCIFAAENTSVTKNHIMKRVLLFLICALLIGEAYSQAPFRCGNLSGSFSRISFSYISDTIVPHTQKTVLCDVDTLSGESPIYRSVSITNFKKPNGRVVSWFILTEEDDIIADDCTQYLHVILPDSIRVNDVEYFDDTIYFCGFFNTIYRMGFVAKISVSDLFSGEISTADYFRIGYDVKKLRAFADNNHSQKTTVLAMGTNKVQGEPYALPAPYFGAPTEWVVPDPEYFDFLFLHCPTFGYSRFYQCTLDTTQERFQDFTVSRGCADLVSLRYPADTNDYYYTMDSVLTSDKLVYMKFRTPDLYVKVNTLDIKFYDDATEEFYDTDVKKGVYNAKIDLLSVDHFVLTFSYFSNNIYSTFVNRVVFNMGKDNAKFDNKMCSRIHQWRIPKNVIDFEYINSLDRLQVLTRGMYDEGGVYDLEMSPETNGNYFLKSTPTTYYQTEEIIPKDIWVNPYGNNLWHTIGSFNGIVKLRENCFRLTGESVAGSFEDAFSTFQFVRSTTSSCHENEEHTIVNTPFPIKKDVIATSIENRATSSVLSFNRLLQIPTYEIGFPWGNCSNDNLDDIF